MCHFYNHPAASSSLYSPLLPLSHILAASASLRNMSLGRQARTRHPAPQTSSVEVCPLCRRFVCTFTSVAASGGIGRAAAAIAAVFGQMSSCAAPEAACPRVPCRLRAPLVRWTTPQPHLNAGRQYMPYGVHAGNSCCICLHLLTHCTVCSHICCLIMNQLKCPCIESRGGNTSKGV